MCDNPGRIILHFAGGAKGCTLSWILFFKLAYRTAVADMSSQFAVLVTVIVHVGAGGTPSKCDVIDFIMPVA